jgi:tripartite-type tricarboxylate transporter receptor subunit TctC
MLRASLARVLFVVTIVSATPACADDYPSKPTRIVVPYPAGGSVDLLARLVAERFQAKWNQPFFIENRSGSSGNIGSDAVFRAAPDGTTLLFAPPGPLVVNQSLFRKLTFDPNALVPISIVVSNANVLVVPAKSPFKNVQDLIDYTKANPDRLNYASQGNGTTAHLSAELFKAMAGVKIVHVPYKGAAPAIADLIGGQVDLMFEAIGNALPLIRGGNLRVLAVTSEQRSLELPDTPTMAEVLPGYTASVWYGLLAPPGTAAPIVDQLSAVIAEALKQPDVAKQLRSRNFDPIGSSPAKAAQFMSEERERWGGVIRNLGLVLD